MATDEDMKMLLFAAEKIHDALLAIHRQLQDINDMLSESLDCTKEEEGESR